VRKEEVKMRRIIDQVHSALGEAGRIFILGSKRIDTYYDVDTSSLDARRPIIRRFSNRGVADLAPLNLAVALR
jgi:hypothetical protein